ncbi:MAG: hydrogenase maturation protease [Thermoanaerobaculaceae bacterium]|nr:hydrogenase maturation protease [Thermoanaerobaculaceae bacterium]
MHKLRHAPGDTEEALTALLESVAGPGPVYVLGLGYADKADDGAGVLVAENLKKPFPSFSFSEHDGVEGTVLDISEREGPATVFFVDAADLRSPPGSIEVVERGEIRDTEISTHRVPVTLMAAILERTGKRVCVVAVQPRTLEFRAAMSEEMSAAVGKVTRAALRLMESRNG